MDKLCICTALLALACTATADVLHLKCRFGLMANPAEVSQQSSPFLMEFIVDSDAGTSYIVGSQGTAPVEMTFGKHSFVFVEYTDAQNVMTTSILHDTQNPDLAGWAVHSRHTFFTGENGAIPQPSQFYGRCSPQ